MPLTATAHRMDDDLIVVTTTKQADGQSVVARYNRKDAKSLRLTPLAKRLGITKRDVRDVL
jgi:hypothetical protein